jgi:hypothetical protein
MPALLSPLERADLNRWTTPVIITTAVRTTETRLNPTDGTSGCNCLINHILQSLLRIDFHGLGLSAKYVA